MKYEPRVPQPPSGWTGSDRDWAGKVSERLNNMPVVSYFSAADPNSLLTGWPGDLAVSVAAASGSSRIWQKYGVTRSTQSWYPIGGGISNSALGQGENLGSGASVYHSTSNVTLYFRSLASSSGISIGASGNTVTFELTVPSSDITARAIAEMVTEYSFYEGDDENVYEMTNLPSAESEFPCILRDIIQMRGYSEARLVGRVRAAQSAATVHAKYSLNKGGSWAYLDGISGPQLSLSAVTDLAGIWVSLTTTAQQDALVGMFTSGGDGAGDPELAKLKLQFTARGSEIPVPPDPAPGGTPSPVTSTCVVTDTYPIARGLIAWHLSDCGSYTLIAGVRYKVNHLNDLSGSGNTLNPTSDPAISGANVSKGGRAEDESVIAQINGRDPIHFRDAWLPWPTTLFSGATQGEFFVVVKGDNLDPTSLQDRDYSWYLGPNDNSRWATAPSGVTTSHGSIIENFGSTSLRSMIDPPGSLADWRIYNVRAASDNWTAQLDNAVVLTTATNTVSFSTQARMGNRGKNSDLLVAEIAIHNVVLTAAERSSVIAKLQSRWAL